MPELEHELHAALMDALARGGKLSALALLREHHDLPLAQAKEIIDQLASAPGAAQNAHVTPAPELAEAQLAEIRRALAWGRTATADRLYRHATHAKQPTITAFMQELGQSAGGGAMPPCELLLRAAKIYARLSNNEADAHEQIELLDRWSEEERVAAFALIYVLFEAAYALCDQGRTADTAEYADIGPRLAAQCPGFTEECYRYAYGKGMFLSR